MSFDKILIANRGEIAVRVIRTAKELGYRTVAVYSEADANTPHVKAADEAVAIGPPQASKSYLNVEAVLAAAETTGAQAVHPGYGFLAENADFARACAEAGIVFIGPPTEAIELMGNKREAKARMLEAGVPCIDGYHGEEQSEARFATEAERIGFPVMVKAAAGGGGRGMRLVTEAAGLADALSGARAEAESAFASGELLLEQAVIEPRHVEIQVFGDSHGNVVHLGERDCSIQRRHQKVIEESPSPAVDAELRAKMGDAAVAAAQACGYVGAGTVEFLLDREGKFFFLEMNTRLQVEHPVTELVTGVDLVEWQLRVAAGETLPRTQDEITFRGHAIEARLYAEDPARGFLPQTGPVLRWRVPDNAAIRVDSGVAEGGEVSPYYDPMIAKVIAYGKTRDDARRQLSSALRDSTLFGLVTNKTFLARICEHPVFAEGNATTAFLADSFADDPSCSVQPPGYDAFAIAAVLRLLQGAAGIAEDESFIGWTSGGPVWTTAELMVGDTVRLLNLRAVAGTSPGCFTVTDGADLEEGDEPESVEVEVVRNGPDSLDLVVGGVLRTVRYLTSGMDIWLDDGSATYCVDDRTHAPAESEEEAAGGKLRAPLDGVVWSIEVSQGDVVKKGQVVLVLEAMKMEHRISAGIDGVVGAINVALKEQVKTRQLLAEIRPSGGE